MSEGYPMYYDATEEVRSRVQAALDEDFAGDGRVEVLEIDADRVARVRLPEACASCPATAQSWIMGIEEAVRRRVPEIRYVEVVP